MSADSSQFNIDDLLKLSKLSLDEKQKEALHAELEQILKYVKQLDEVDTSGVEPSYQLSGLNNIVRADQPDQSEKPAEIMKSIKNVKNGYIEVSKVL